MLSKITLKKISKLIFYTIKLANHQLYSFDKLIQILFEKSFATLCEGQLVS